MKKPLPVKIVEALGWTYVALVVLGCAVRICQSGDPTFFIAAIFPLALTLGMVLLLRRGSRSWFLCPNTMVWGLVGIFMVGAGLYHEQMIMVRLFTGLLLLAFMVAPIVLLHLQPANRWFGEMSGGKPDRYGCSAVFCSVIMAFSLVFILPEIICSRCSSRMVRLQFSGRALFGPVTENNAARGAGEVWVDPDACTNSTQFVQALCDKYKDGAGGRVSDLGPYTNIWCIAVNPPNDDRFPVLFTANIDPRELLRPSGEGQPLKLTCPKEWGGVCFKFCEKMGVVHYKNGVSQIVKKHMSPKQIFCSGIPKPGPETYFLTPTGRVDFVERQGSAMAISMNLKLISIDKSERCVVAEFLLENCSQRGVFVFGSKDALTTYFMKDGVWVLCSTANDVGNEPAEERGLFVEKGSVLRVSGRIPQECLLAKWFLVVGIGTRSKDEMESIVASPIYSRDNESGDRLSFKMEMNSVFKGRLKAFIANE